MRHKLLYKAWTDKRLCRAVNSCQINWKYCKEIFQPVRTGSTKIIETDQLVLSDERTPHDD